jgi:Tol biopolymer transport system component
MGGMRATILALVACLLASSSSAQSIDDLIALRRTTGTPAVSADGRLVAYTVRETNWTDNSYETEVWLADARTAGSGRQITMAKKSSLQPAFSPDGRWLAFISDRSDTRQLYRLSLEGGEAEALTSGTEGVTAFAWSPDGTRIAYTMTDPVTPEMKARTEQYGEYTHEDHDARRAQLTCSTSHEDTRPSRAARSWWGRSTGRPTTRGSPSITA